MIDDIKWKLQEWWDGTTKKTKIIIAVAIVIVIAAIINS
jgi:flagellar biosynthesis/type III secretory pathway M-ring protein FliF/YscJ|tara:strand:- start:2203 stop:2319 length:117 start_codon:yes stop_codon:yes gene_type:complete